MRSRRLPVLPRSVTTAARRGRDARKPASTPERALASFVLCVGFALAASAAGAGAGGPGVGITSVSSQADTEVGATGARDVRQEFDLDSYEHELERITPATEEGAEDSRELARQTSHVSAGTGGLSVTSRGEAVLEAPRHVGLGVASFSVSFSTDQPVTVSFSAQVQVEAPGSDGSSNAAASFSCGCDPEDDPNECSVQDVDFEVEDSPGTPRSGSVSASGRANGGCSLSVFLSTSLGVDQASAKASWTASLSVSTTTAPEQGTVFRWVGPAQGGFGDAGNWQDENGLEGVPGFRSFEDADTAIVQGEGNVTMDLASGLSRGLAARGPGVSRQTGRLAIRSTQSLQPVGGTLILDSLEPGIAERSLEIGGATLRLDQGGVKARHVVVGLLGDGALDVVGPDGFFTTEGRFGIGGESDGTVTIRDGAQVTSAETVLGEEDGSGFASVEGAGTLWQTGNLAVGLADDAGLFVDAGARVESENAFVDCQLAAGPGVPGCSGLAGDEKAEVTLTGSSNGTPSTWALAGDLEIGARGKVSVEGGAVLDPAIVRVGTSGSEADCLAGRACLEVVDGVVSSDGIAVGLNGAGKLRIGPAGRVAGLVGVAIGSASGSRGEVVVTGPSAEPQLTGDLLVGTEIGSHGELLVENGAQVSAGGSSVGGEPGSFGLVEIQANGAPPDATVLRIDGTGSESLDLGVDLAGPDALIFGETGELALAGGRLELNDADLEIHRTGLVSGTGRIDGFGVSFVSNGGRIGCGVLVNAAYTQAPDGVLECPQASTPSAPQLNPLERSRLVPSVRKKKPPVALPPRGPFVVTGDASLDGTLALSFLNGVAPRLGDTFELLDVGGNITGQFGQVLVTGLAPGSFDFASDLADGKLTLTSLSDAVALPPLSLKSKTKLKEKSRGGLKLKIKRGGDLSVPLVVHYGLGGTAKNGVDYAQIPLSVEIPARKRSASVVFRPLADGAVEGPETVQLELLPGDGYSLPLVSKVTVELIDAKVKK